MEIFTSQQIYLQSEAIEYIETLCKCVSWAQTMNYYIFKPHNSKFMYFYFLSAE